MPQEATVEHGVSGGADGVLEGLPNVSLAQIGMIGESSVRTAVRLIRTWLTQIGPPEAHRADGPAHNECAFRTSPAAGNGLPLITGNLHSTDAPSL